MTPPIPTDIREHCEPGYVNVYSLCPDETRLFGTEDLYGDWNGDVLLLAKDFACSRFVFERMERGDARPFGHDPSLRTNVLLRGFADPLRNGPTPATCGVLYGSALACLLRDDGQMSGLLPSRAGALRFGSRVLRFVIENMPRLRVVICLGSEAWDCAMLALCREVKWAVARDSCEPVDHSDLRVIAAYHPAARITHESAGRPWRLVCGTLERVRLAA